MRTDDDLDILDLNALVRPVGRVKLDTELYDVFPVQGEAVTIFEQIAADTLAQSGQTLTRDEQNKATQAYLDKARRIVHAVAPSIPHDRVRTLALTQLMGIVERSMGVVRQVQALRERSAKKGRGSTPKGTRTTSGRR